MFLYWWNNDLTSALSIRGFFSGINMPKSTHILLTYTAIQRYADLIHYLHTTTINSSVLKYYGKRPLVLVMSVRRRQFFRDSQKPALKPKRKQKDSVSGKNGKPNMLALLLKRAFAKTIYCRNWYAKRSKRGSKQKVAAVNSRKCSYIICWLAISIITRFYDVGSATMRQLFKHQVRKVNKESGRCQF